MNNPPGPTLRGESREKEGVQIGAAKKKKPKHFFIRNESDKEEEEEKYTEGGRWKKKKAVNNMDLAKYQDHSGLPPWRI